MCGSLSQESHLRGGGVSMVKPYVIIGTGAAGIAAAERPVKARSAHTDDVRRRIFPLTLHAPQISGRRAGRERTFLCG